MGAFALILRLVAAALFAAALFSFTRPFVELYAGESVGSATGIELVLGDPSVSGPAAGPVESRLEDAEPFALVAFAAALAGIVLSLVPGRIGPALGLLAALTGLAGLAGILYVTASPDVPVATDRRFGLWLAGIALAGAAACCAAALLTVRDRLSPAGGRGGRRPPRSRPLSPG